MWASKRERFAGAPGVSQVRGKALAEGQPQWPWLSAGRFQSFHVPTHPSRCPKALLVTRVVEQILTRPAAELAKQSADSPFDAIVVGGGTAGIVAATTLVENGKISTFHFFAQGFQFFRRINLNAKMVNPRLCATR